MILITLTLAQVDLVSCYSNQVILIKAPKTAVNAVFGGLMATRAKTLGAKGAIISGRIRDVQEITDLGFHTYASGTSTLGAKPFARVVAVNQKLELGSLEYPVVVSDGDVVFADVDGVVCFPPTLLSSVADMCKTLTDVDSKCMDDIRNGSSIRDSFARHRGK